jgi:hypothetical protein
MGVDLLGYGYSLSALSGKSALIAAAITISAANKNR